MADRTSTGYFAALFKELYNDGREYPGQKEAAQSLYDATEKFDFEAKQMFVDIILINLDIKLRANDLPRRVIAYLEDTKENDRAKMINKIFK